ncbi:TIGR00725 family protein [Archaeoglobus profundus]|uniref:TIGR00725 family protein n=1 Tax=Archaeoglobus profundus (strain DSM 5631 / JCM 9629 / NBRC 100127 / Av18) TaxID=572546 RepID=D2RHE0_ARCPA|nr:TIGR00725 family protein [Archaeoglobus profundus]ADB57715.1 conserved hypothetical protein [Archaeoglobus profundus DSM 5631]
MIQVAVVGSERCDERHYRIAYEVGRLLAERGCVVVNGGLGGIMEASAAGAKLKGGLTVGIIPSDRKEDANQYIDIVIVTDMGHARNVIIAQSCDAMIAIGGGYGTISEMAIALKLGKKVVAIEPEVVLPGLEIAESPEEAVDKALEGLA